MPTDWSGLVQKAMETRPLLDLPRDLKLPSLPQSVIEFTAVANDPTAGPKELAAPIEADSALTSELLRQVNSAAMGLRRIVVSIPQAVNLLGPRRTKTLVLTSALQTSTARTKSRLINITQFRNENRARAVFARKAAQGFGADGEVAYIAGLLQDFLLPLLTEAFYSDYVGALQQERELVEEERNRFGWDHAQVAAGVMYEWGFPDELVACVLLHHEAKRVISDTSLRETSVGASVVGASLPDSLCQSPSGFETLLEFQKELTNFRFLEVASIVDEELSNADPLEGQKGGLYERLEKLAEASLEERRQGSVHRHGQVGNYILEDQIGQGAMGVIYLARHCMLKRPAAIKVLRAATINAKSLTQFETEVQLTCRLTSPHTVSVYDYGVTPEGLFYYVMEYLEGVTLAHLVREHGPQSSGRVIHFLRQVCSSLVEAHAINLIHSDLKPENMMVCHRGGVADTLKVLDFGLAKIVSEHADRNQIPTGMSGTPLYMPPEAITAPQTVCARSDLYSLGAVGYFLLTGHPVFAAKDLPTILRSHVSDAPERPSLKLGSPIDEDLEDIILQCLSKPLDQRPATAAELDCMLSRCQSARSWNQQDAVQWWSHHEAHQLPKSPTITSDDRNDVLSTTIIAES
ncbi:MAG: HDOD domain-containing protein [Planctomycetota bacterium]